MIRVVPRQEYAAFDRDVRQPGAAFLARTPVPTSKQFGQNRFWSKAARELHAAYGGICAYTAMYLPEQGSVDHFLPKATHPSLAYEWSNYRLAGGRVNSAKGNQSTILDPFGVQNDWFFLEIPSCMLKPNPELNEPLLTQIAETISGLKLNFDDFHVQERCNILIEYATGEISNGFLMRRYPFLAKEVARQQLDLGRLKQIFRLAPAPAEEELQESEPSTG